MRIKEAAREEGVGAAEAPLTTYCILISPAPAVIIPEGTPYLAITSRDVSPLLMNVSVVS